MFSGASLSDGTSIDGGSHGAEGKDEKDGWSSGFIGSGRRIVMDRGPEH